jgi:lactate permease
MHWTQIYDPFGHWWLSTLVAALPILVLFGLLAGLKVRPHLCAIAGALTAGGVAVIFFKMPLTLAAMSFGYGVAFGLLKIAWIVLAAVYLYDISVETGQFEIMKESIAAITPDRRLQVLLVAFCFGAFIEGAAGFGAPAALPRGGAESDCQHGTGGLGRNRHSRAYAGSGLRAARIRP